MIHQQELIRRYIATWKTYARFPKDDPLCVILSARPEYLPLIQEKSWYNRGGVRTQRHHVLGLDIEGRWAEDDTAKGRVGTTFADDWHCFSLAPFTLSQLARAADLYPGLADRIWSRLRVEEIQRRYLQAWQQWLVDAYQRTEIKRFGPVQSLGMRAAVVLGRLGLREGSQALEAGLTNASEEVRSRAVAGLGWTSPGRGVAALVQTLRDDRAESVRSEVARSLGKIGDKTSLPTLIAYLHDEDAVQLNSIDALVSLGHPGARGPLVALVKDNKSNDLGGAKALLTIQTFPGADDHELVRQAMGAQGAQVRSAAAYLIGELGYGDEIEALRAALYDADAQVRATACMALARLGDDSAVPRMLELAHSADSVIFQSMFSGQLERESTFAWIACEILAGKGSVRANDALAALRNHTN